LIPLVCCSNGTTCHVPSNQQTGTDNIIEASFGIASKQKDIKGALLYKLQREYATRTDNRSNSSTTSVRNTTKNMCLLVTWDVKDEYHKFCAFIIGYTYDLTWDEDKLMTDST
jgi:hypothetical protein